MAGAQTAGDQTPAEYHHGEMQVVAQRSMYMRFNGLVHWACTVIGALVAFLVLWLCAHIAFLASAFVAVVIVAAGVWMNRNTGHNAGY